jgi:hypothetical protein
MLLKCDTCNKEFEKRKAEYNRRVRVKPDTKFFCSRTCTVRYKNKVSPSDASHLNGYVRLSDEYSPFRYFVRKARSRKHDYDIDVAYLKELWEEQDGKCALSGLKMILPKNGEVWEKDKENPWKPSLDRIDSDKGYLKGNVRFTCYIGNMCKQRWPDNTVYEFCKEVAKNMARPVRCGGLDYKDEDETF